MTEQDKAFIATHKAWLQSVKLNRQEFEDALSYDKKRVELAQQQISNNIDQIYLIDNYRDQGIASFNAWCAENGIDPETV